MSLASTYHLQQSLPNRSSSTRPRSVSLSEYQPLPFDRDASAAQYQQALAQPSSSSSSRTRPSHGSVAGSTDSHQSPSTLTRDLRPGDNPHEQIDLQNLSLDHGDVPIGMAGVGAGHCLTPPHSPFHKPAQLQQEKVLLSPIPPTPPLRPTEGNRASPGYFPPVPPRPRAGKGRDTADYEQNGEGYASDPGHSIGNIVRRPSRRQLRQLPPIPTNVPQPSLPQWEPDYKPHIPAGLVEPSIQDAYAQLSAPPPNLPPRRHHRVASHDPANFYYGTGSSSSQIGRSQVSSSASNMTNGASSSSRPTVTSIPTNTTISTAASTAVTSSAAHRPSRPKRDAEKEVTLRATEGTPIWSTHLFDPYLRGSARVPHSVTNIANVALSTLSSGPKESYNEDIGAPIDGLARAAKEWIVPPDGRFFTEYGGMELGIGVIDSGVEGWGREKGRKRARVEAISKTGGIKVDIIELDEDRQLDLKIETREDVVVFIPPNFNGHVHVHSGDRAPQFMPHLVPQIEPISNPYANFWTTLIHPLPKVYDPRAVHERKPSTEYRAVSGIQRYVPESFREQSDVFDQIVGGFASHSRAEQSKVRISTQKGKVFVGYRNTQDEEDIRTMNLMVGAHQGKKKRWWRG